MAYELGIDLGTTYTAASIRRRTSSGWADPEVVALSTRSAAVASVLFLAPDGSVLVGEAAERRALTDPDRVAREFKRRIGDDIPVIVGGQPRPAHELAALLVRWVVDRVAQQENGPASGIAVTHPASWGPHKKHLLGQALAGVGLPGVTFLAEPQAAAVNYALAERVEPGSTIAVYDLGGGTFDAAVVHKTASGAFELLGRPQGIERLGGIDFDEAVFAHVRAGLGNTIEMLDITDPVVVTAVARLRRECIDAKEALSADTEVTIPVLLPGLQTQARLHRAEFEDMIRPAITETVEALRGALNSAGVTPAQLTAVLLVGGSSRIPLVAQLVSGELGRPVAVDTDPKLAIAFGAVCALSPSVVARAATETPQPMPMQGSAASSQAASQRAEPAPRTVVAEPVTPQRAAAQPTTAPFTPVGPITAPQPVVQQPMAHQPAAHHAVAQGPHTRVDLAPGAVARDTASSPRQRRPALGSYRGPAGSATAAREQRAANFQSIRPVLTFGGIGLVVVAVLLGIFAIQQLRSPSRLPESPSVTPSLVTPAAPADGDPEVTVTDAPLPTEWQDPVTAPPAPTRTTAKRTTDPTTTKHTTDQTTTKHTTEPTTTEPTTTEPTTIEPTATTSQSAAAGGDGGEEQGGQQPDAGQPGVDQQVGGQYTGSQYTGSQYTGGQQESHQQAPAGGS